MGVLWHYLFLYVLEYDEEGWYHDDKGDGSDEHSADSTHSDGNVSVGSHAAGEHKRKHTEDHGQRRHEDRSETNLCG